ncbi:MAG TPA: hypothetical protein VFI27_14880 [candidate division Zixibacteria bacterium]|nr:hypothetical protein [candidate division Zixibacteria bacterium]
MTEASYIVGDSFRLHFVWRIPNEDYLRAIFETEVLHLDDLSGKYVVLLSEFVAGRQESNQGAMRLGEELSRDYWGLVANLAGQRISVAYEADDGRPLWLRLETLTGEHNFFRRLNELPEKFASFKRDEQ